MDTPEAITCDDDDTVPADEEPVIDLTVSPSSGSWYTALVNESDCANIS